MAYSKVDDMKTYVIKMKINCECDGCQGKLEGYRNILGVKSVDVDDEEKKVTISIIGDPKKVVEKLKKQKKTFELIEQTLPIKKQEMQIVLQNPVPEIKKQEMQIVLQNPVPEIHDRRVVAQQPALEIDKSIVKKTQGCCPKHGYKLEKKSYNKRFTCDGCKEKGCGSGYRCEHCDYELHEECMSLEHSISPEIFPRSTFEFCHQPSSTHPRSCDACGNYIKGYLYACNARNLALHPCCSNLKANLCIGGMDFILHNKVSSSSKCKRCNQKTPKTRNPCCSYVSTCNKYHFHVYCITQMVHEAWTNGDIDGSTDDFAMTLEKMDLKPVETKNRNSGSGGNNIWRTISIFISTIAACLLGDPTGVLVPLFLGFFIKSIPKLLPKLD
ncbi:hypothetical protein ACSBR1_007641 [Camellia fascicularis]